MVKSSKIHGFHCIGPENFNGFLEPMEPVLKTHSKDDKRAGNFLARSNQQNLFNAQPRVQV